MPTGSPRGPRARSRTSVWTKSGYTMVTVTPVSASSMRSESKNPAMACLLAA